MTFQLLIGIALSLWLVSIVACVLAWRFSFLAKHFVTAIILSLAAMVMGYLGLTHVHLQGSKTVNGVTQWSFNSRWFFITTLVLAALTLAYTLWKHRTTPQPPASIG